MNLINKADWHTHEKCTTCEKPVELDRVVMAEMCVCWKPFGMCGDTKPEHSQGWFPFGADCAKKLGFKIKKELNEESGNTELFGFWENKQ